MEQIGFQRYAFQTVFGFTDSIFLRHLNNDNNKHKTTTAIIYSPIRRTCHTGKAINLNRAIDNSVAAAKK
jgi:hypothetical protein